MKTRLAWDETKRLANLAKHGLDFSDAGLPASEIETEFYYEWLAQEND